MRAVRYDHAFTFAYSERPATFAARKYPDDVSEAVKKRRLAEIIALQQTIAATRHQERVGRCEVVLVEGTSKRSEEQLRGRTDGNHMVIFDHAFNLQKGDYAQVDIIGSTSATLFGRVVQPTTLGALPAIAA